MRSLADDRNFVIKKADKGSCVVVWDRNDYLLKLEYLCCFLQVSNKSFATLRKNISRAGWPLGGPHEDLVLKHGTLLNCGVSSF